MKYDILVQKGGFLYVKVCLWIFLLVKNNICQKNIRLFSPKIGDLFLLKSVSGYSKTKKGEEGKEVAWTTNSLGGGGP